MSAVMPRRSMFSSRVPDLAPNPVALALQRLRSSGTPFDDLTESNPTAVGFDYPRDLLEGLADPASLRYEPAPFGLPQAREAVAAEYAARGIAVPADRVVLTASSSESYSMLFKLLCDPGDSVLVPTPGYPLFAHLGSLDAVSIRPYATEFHGTWQIDLGGIGRAIDRTTRAVLVVSPGNPTGAFLKRDELEALSALCAEHDLALVCDEVFADFPVDPAPSAVPSALVEVGALVFALGGLSKSVGLPQLKLGWIAVGGPGAGTSEALARLELIADTYLSVATPVQHAARRLLDAGRTIREQILRRLRHNYDTLRRTATRYPACRVLPVEGGWAAIVQTPATVPAEQRVIDLLERARVLVHPGDFFEFSREGYLVASLLTPPDVFGPAVGRLFDAVAAE